MTNKQALKKIKQGETEGLGLEIMELINEYNKAIAIKSIDELTLNSVEKVFFWLRNEIGTQEREYFKVIFLNSKNQYLGDENLFLGTIDKASIYTREIVKQALKCNAKSVIFAHNHPSGSCRPSRADIEMTGKIANVLNALEINILDHMIVTPTTYYSFLEEGILS